MTPQDLDSWAALRPAIEELRAEHARASEPGSHLLFRGQSDSRWGLGTTLERRFPNLQWSWKDYYHLVRSTLPLIQSFTGRVWKFPTYDEFGSFGSDFDDQLKTLPGYEYLVYVRHHGFPSPLLDWSRSPFVAAFFAYRHRDAGADRVAIYCYQERASSSKFGSSSEPQIHTHGPYVTSHPRHVLQQCEYTTCNIFDDRKWTYADHSAVFALGSTKQDRLWKFTLPASERIEVLKELDAYNLNAYSLFPMEDALLETVALREIEFRGRFK